MAATNRSKTAVPIVFGAMTFGKKGAEQSRVHTLEGCSQILDVFQKHGHNEVDTAIAYGEGSSEEYLGQLDWQSRNIVMDTKYYPFTSKGWDHSPGQLRAKLMESLKSLKAKKVDMWYLHGPDRSTPYEVTMKAVDELHREGYFDRFAISNYQAWEVAQICEICEKNGWVKPAVYQGIYNAVHRAVEPELFPCLRHYGMGFYAYNPLAGGYLTDRYKREDQDMEETSRFDPNTRQGKMYRQRYWNDAYFDALDILRPVCKKLGLTEAECALRWMMHHSVLDKSKGDAVIMGASSVMHAEQNCIDYEKGPLPEEVLKAFDEAWDRVRGVAWKYWH